MNKHLLREHVCEWGKFLVWSTELCLNTKIKLLSQISKCNRDLFLTESSVLPSSISTSYQWWLQNWTQHSLTQMRSYGRWSCFHGIEITSSVSSTLYWQKMHILAVTSSKLSGGLFLLKRIEAQSQPGKRVPWDPISRNPSQKKGLWSGSRYRPWVQAPVLKTKQNIVSYTLDICKNNKRRQPNPEKQPDQYEP
jgi:hypothetical protein